MRLTDQELRDVLARADEIQRTSRHGDEWHAEIKAVIGAAEEVGLSRTAVERALRERFEVPAPPAVGALAWTKSADGRFYVAVVLATSEESVRVRFLSGSEHVVRPEDVRPCAFIPGERVSCNWPWWGPWTCTVESYDPVKKRVRLNDGWGYTRNMPISEVWVTPKKPEGIGSRSRVYYTLFGAGAAVGGLAGALLTVMILRLIP